MTLLYQVRRTAQRFGIDVTRYPYSAPEFHLVRLLQRFRIDLVLDVGANSGQYGSMLRRFGYRRRIASFEPLNGPLKALRRKADTDPLWTVYPYALGDETITVTVNVAGNAGASSSVLPMLPRHAEACPESRYVSQQESEQRSLADLWPQMVGPNDRVFLKLDVQGYEEAVLRGAGDHIDRCSGLQTEVSCIPLYEGGQSFEGALNLALRRFGMTLMGVVPGFIDPLTGQMLQFDAIFFRDELGSDKRPNV